MIHSKFSFPQNICSFFAKITAYYTTRNAGIRNGGATPEQQNNGTRNTSGIYQGDKGQNSTASRCRGFLALESRCRGFLVLEY